MARGGRREGAGRSPKPPGKKYLKKTISFEPEVWAWIEGRVGKGDRSAYINRLVQMARKTIEEN